MILATTEHCVLCLHQRDSYATYEQYHQSSIAPTAPPNQLDPSSGRTKRSEREFELAEMPAEDLTSAGLQWFCCQCKKSNVIAVSYKADDRCR